MMQQIRYWPMCLVLGAGLGASIGYVLARQLPSEPVAAALAVGVVLAAPLVWMMSRALWRRLTMLDKPWADRHPALVAAVLAATAAGTGVALGGSSDALTAIWLRVLGLVVVSAMGITALAVAALAWKIEHQFHGRLYLTRREGLIFIEGDDEPDAAHE